MAIEFVELRRFTAFESFEFRPSPGVNVFIGANGTGKTHLMKVAYAACDVSKTKDSFAENSFVSSSRPETPSDVSSKAVKKVRNARYRCCKAIGRFQLLFRTVLTLQLQPM